ncbi:hypothetical protein DESHY_20179 [Desulforamulus hydrothermalis Lam5 = DSM 18033]|uniref:Uncharacterized protein n=1 Tax=Desulforamulus hydrothermalis Lam5 = DSM 18033 TaxID=1121428 RepID=K8DZC2_9FIRM|nr:hypothetical protein DESHY_20179 [Desulforamulus hydrothermalis Lam5 = DSM 18033]
MDLKIKNWPTSPFFLKNEPLKFFLFFLKRKNSLGFFYKGKIFLFEKQKLKNIKPVGVKFLFKKKIKKQKKNILPPLGKLKIL